MASKKQLVHTDRSNVILKIGENLYLSESKADFHFVFEIADNQFERIPAHKILLETASDVFDTMFNGSWEENDEVEITDATVDEFKEFLQFFYLRQVKISMDKVAKVMYLGNKYNITRCMNVCEKFIIKTLNEDNACWAYELAIIHNQENLRKYCETFIGMNTKAVLASNNFLKCNSKVLSHILKLDSLSCSEYEVFEACMNWVKTNAQVDQLTRELVEAHLGELFYEVRIKSMTPLGFVKFVFSYGRLFSIDELMEISQAIVIKEFQPNIFGNKIRTSFEDFKCNEKDILHCDRIYSTYYSAVPYFIKNVETTKFSTNKPLFLIRFECCSIHKYVNHRYHGIDELPTEITIVQVPDSANSGEKLIFKTLIYSLKSVATFVELPKPTLIRPCCMYEIRMNQSPSESVCSGSLLKSKVNLKSNITVQFHEDPTVGHDDNPTLDHDENPRGTIYSLQFSPIENFSEKKKNLTEEYILVNDIF